MSKAIKLEPGIDPTQQTNVLPSFNIGIRILIIGLVVLAIGGLCLFGVPFVSAKINPTKTPTVTPTQTAMPASATPTATEHVSADLFSSDGGGEPATVEVEVTRQVEVVVTQIVNQSNTVIVTRVVSGPVQVQTEIVQVPVTQLVPVTQIVVVTVPWIITVTPQAPTLTAMASYTPTPSPTSTAAATATATASATPTPTETETPTP